MVNIGQGGRYIVTCVRTKGGTIVGSRLEFPSACAG